MEFTLAEACTSLDSYQLQFKKRIRWDLKKAAAALSKIGEVFGETRVVLLAKVNGAGVSLYEDGRIIIKDVRKEAANEIGKTIVTALEQEGALL